MRKLFTIALFTLATLFGAMTSMPVSKSFVDSNVTIIDIRTAPEWHETGVIKDSHLITFFDERGNYNVPKFLGELKKVVKPGEKFALICRTGSRSEVVANFLGQNGFNVVNLQGGIMYAKSVGIKLQPHM